MLHYVQDARIGIVTYRDTGSFNSLSPTSYLDVIVPGQKFGKLVHPQTMEKHA